MLDYKFKRFIFNIKKSAPFSIYCLMVYSDFQLPLFCQGKHMNRQNILLYR